MKKALVLIKKQASKAFYELLKIGNMHYFSANDRSAIP